jgi:hypothetical protein
MYKGMLVTRVQRLREASLSCVATASFLVSDSMADASVVDIKKLV